MLNNKNEVVSVLPIKNVNGGYVQKTYAVWQVTRRNLVLVVLPDATGD